MSIKKIKLKCKTKRRKINKIRPFTLRSDLIYFPSFGFTLIELLVAISIFLVVTAITLANFPSFSNKLALNLLAEDISLSIKQAQVFGSSIYGIKTGTGKTFDAVGVHFERPLSPLTTRETILDYHYTLYADLLKNNTYDGTMANVRNPGVPRGDNLKANNINCGSPTVAEECLDKYIINGANKVLYLCANYMASGSTKEARIADCKTSPTQIKTVDITFMRASLEANFSVKNTADMSVGSIENVGIVLGIPSATGAIPSGSFQKTIIIWKTGLTSLE